MYCTKTIMKSFNWAAQNLQLGRMRPKDRGLDITGYTHGKAAQRSPKDKVA